MVQIHTRSHKKRSEMAKKGDCYRLQVLLALGRMISRRLVTSEVLKTNSLLSDAGDFLNADTKDDY